MSFFQNKIRALRKSKGITQEELANILNVKRSLIGAYEEGRAEPKFDLLKRIANIFEVSADALIGKPTSYQQEVKVLAISVDNRGQENIELVPIKARAGYLSGYGDLSYISSLPKFQLPFLRNGTYRAFEIQGESMLPLLSGTIIVGEYVSNVSDLELLKTYVWVTKNDGIVYKRLGSISSKKEVELLSDNPSYASLNLSFEEIAEVWCAKIFISSNFPDF